MNKLHHASKSATRTRSGAHAASVRRSLLEREDFEEAAEAPWLAVSGDEEDWPEVETDESDVATEISLLLNGIAHR
jgi:hypothetical protein